MFADRDTVRLRKQAERDKRLGEIYRQCPQLRRLDDALAAAGREGLLRVWEGGNIDAAKQKIAMLQVEKDQLLSSLGFDERIYDADWDCPRCQDRGYIRPGEPCTCRLQDDGLRRLTESGLSSLQRKQTFENFSLRWYDRPADAERLVEQIKGFVSDLIADRPCGNLFLYGPVGNGKTHLCSAAANLLLGAGKTVLYIRTEELLEALREDIYGRGEYTGRRDYVNRGDGGESGVQRENAPNGRGRLQGRLFEADLLILEDLGTERLTDFAEEQLTNVVDLRINWQKPWMITSHLIGDAFTGRYDPRLVDRILGEGKRLYLNENSIRFKRAQKEKTGQST